MNLTDRNTFMKNFKWISIFVLFLIIAAVFQNKFSSTKNSSLTEVKKSEVTKYWTCPMHPQVHQDHPGECPICHMKLVQLKDTSKKETQSTSKSATSVQATSEQLDLAGVQKTRVEKMTLNAQIPISGRIISATSVAFQIYETDLNSVHVGLNFQGSTTTSASENIYGVIQSVDSVIDPTSRTVRAVGLLRKSPKSLIIETSFSGAIEIKKEHCLSIPESSVLHTGEDDLVYLIDENLKLTPRKVLLGLKTEGFFEVLGGLNEGDTISSGPNFLIDSEAKIRGAND